MELINYRINGLKDALELYKTECEPDSYLIIDTEARIDELETLKAAMECKHG